jgi:hypothetical protein
MEQRTFILVNRMMQGIRIMGQDPEKILVIKCPGKAQHKKTGQEKRQREVSFPEQKGKKEKGQDDYALGPGKGKERDHNGRCNKGSPEEQEYREDEDKSEKDLRQPGQQHDEVKGRQDGKKKSKVRGGKGEVLCDPVTEIPGQDPKQYIEQFDPRESGQGKRGAQDIVKRPSPWIQEKMQVFESIMCDEIMVDVIGTAIIAGREEGKDNQDYGESCQEEKGKMLFGKGLHQISPVLKRKFLQRYKENAFSLDL